MYCLQDERVDDLLQQVYSLEVGFWCLYTWLAVLNLCLVYAFACWVKEPQRPPPPEHHFHQPLLPIDIAYQQLP